MKRGAADHLAAEFAPTACQNPPQILRGVMNNSLPSSDHVPKPCCASHDRFQPEDVFDLLRPIETIVSTLANEYHGQDLRQKEVRTSFIIAADQKLLDRVPWSRVVPPSLREALVGRVLRTYWWGQGGVLEPVSGAN
jgi:hypothetical protein